MHRLRDAVPGIKARTDCRDLARQLGLPRRRIPFPRPFHDLPLSVGAAADKRYASEALGDALRPYRRAKQSAATRGRRALPPPPSTSPVNTTPARRTRPRPSGPSTPTDEPPRTWEQRQAGHLRYVARTRSGHAPAFVNVPR